MNLVSDNLAKKPLREPLTATERDILAKVLSGVSARQIADAMGLGPKDVIGLLRAVLDKMAGAEQPS